MGICIYCIDKSADTLYLEKGANRFVQAVGNISQSEINSWEHKPLRDSLRARLWLLLSWACCK